MKKYKQKFEVTTLFGGEEIVNEIEITISAEDYEQAKAIFFMVRKNGSVMSRAVSEILIG